MSAALTSVKHVLGLLPEQGEDGDAKPHSANATSTTAIGTTPTASTTGNARSSIAPQRSLSVGSFSAVAVVTTSSARHSPALTAGSRKSSTSSLQSSSVQSHSPLRRIRFGPGTQSKKSVLSTYSEDGNGGGGDLRALSKLGRDIDLTAAATAAVSTDEAFADSDFNPAELRCSPARYSRAAGDLAFYKVLALVLKNTPTALIIEHAQHCDELSWREFLIILMGFDLEMTVLFTMRSQDGEELQGANSNGSTNPSTTHVVPNFNRQLSPMPIKAFPTVPKINDLSTSQLTDFSKSFIQKMPQHADRSFMALNNKFDASEAFQSILQHPNCTIKLMTGLKEEGVRYYLEHNLKIPSLSRELIKTVFRISGGNTYWIKSIATFIKERGLSSFEEAIAQSDTLDDPLRGLIVYRLESLGRDEQLVLRYAAVVGHEFNERLLRKILPHSTPRAGGGGGSATATATAAAAKRRLRNRPKGSVGEKNKLASSSSVPAGSAAVPTTTTTTTTTTQSYDHPVAAALESLTRLGVLCVVRPLPVPLYEFQNQVVQYTVYELVPPRYVILLNKCVFEFSYILYILSLCWVHFFAFFIRFTDELLHANIFFNLLSLIIFLI